MRSRTGRAFARKLSRKNLQRRPRRAAAMALLSALLSFSVFGGSLLIMSLQRGLESYEARLGADIVVVPAQARSHGTFESILLQGIPGYFYMDESYLDKIAAREGVEAVSPQFYLASASAGCCSVSVQIIGFDPATDFSIQPWIAQSYDGTVGDGDVIVGSGITVPADRTLRFYNMDCHVAAKLKETGTGLDNAVYANMSTIRRMMACSRKEGFRYYDGDPETAISSVMVRVADGYDIEQVTGDINIHVRRIEASQAKSMISGIAQGLVNISRVIGLLTVMIWILAIGIMAVAFVMIVGERTQEFAILRVTGASETMVSYMMRAEALTVSTIGALIGTGAAALTVLPFGTAIRRALDLPYLLPSAGSILLIAAGTVAATALVGTCTAAKAVRRITGRETGLLLREGA